MKVYVRGGIMCAEAETLQDIETLQGLKDQKRKMKKQTRAKRYTCPKCGKKCRGAIGLATHTRSCKHTLEVK